MEEDLILTEEEERAVEEGYAAQALLDNPVFLVAIERIRGECAEGILTSPPDHQAAREDLYNLSRGLTARSEEHTSELQSLMRISYAVFCLKKKTKTKTHQKIQPYSTKRTTP